MNIQEVLQLVISNGFAIVVAVWCLKFTFDTLTDKLSNTDAQLTSLASAINDNTVILTSLVDELRKKE